jgi:hypothetical protein
MQDISRQSNRAKPAASGKHGSSLITASRPYITAVLIMTFLLSVWAGLCAA